MKDLMTNTTDTTNVGEEGQVEQLSQWWCSYGERVLTVPPLQIFQEL